MSDDSNEMQNQPVSATLNFRVSGQWSEIEHNHFEVELIRAIENLWDEGVVTPSENDDTLVALDEVVVHNPHPKVLVDRNLRGDPIVQSEVPLDVMHIDRPVDTHAMAALEKGETPGDRSLVPLEVDQPETIEQAQDIGQYHLMEAEVDPYRVQAFFDYGQDEAQQQTFVATAKRFFSHIPDDSGD